MPTVPKEDAKRIGAELKRWSQRPVRSTNARAVALCGAVLALMFIGAQASVRDSRRISNLDMAALWTLVALIAKHFE